MIRRWKAAAGDVILSILPPQTAGRSGEKGIGASWNYDPDCLEISPFGALAANRYGHESSAGRSAYAYRVKRLRKFTAEAGLPETVCI